MNDAERRKAEMAKLVEPQIPALRRYARMLVKDRSTADDLVQDCLERVFARWHLHHAGSPVRPWIFAILHNLAMSHFRRSARQRSHVTIDEVDETALAIPASQEDALNHEQILAAIDRLPDDSRDVFLLVAVEDLSYAEAASVLDIPIGTVMSRLYRARARLQSMLNRNPIPPVTQTLRVVK